MQIPSKEQFSRIFALISEFDHKRESELPDALRELRDNGEPTEVVTYLRLNYSLAAAPEFELLPGERIADRYTVEGVIGAGGMGIVYRAKQDRTQRDVALKLVHPRLSTPELLARFEEEIVTLGKLDHPGIVHIFDADQHEKSIFFTMQLVDGQPLHRHLREHTLTRHQKLDLIIRLAEAVQAAHDRGIIHRDLKPANILIERASGHPVILDFGLATLAGALLADDDRPITGLSGTPNYMSPEQFLGTAGEFGVGQSIDVYALGVIAFEILAGHSPYRFPKDGSWLDKRRVVLEQNPLPLAEEPELEGAVRKAIRKNPGDRYFTASGFAKALTYLQRKLASPEDENPIAWKPAVGATVPATDWVLERMLGEGGIGQVWLARHPVLGESRVFKFCVDEEKVRSLKREASLFRLLKEKVGQHPNMVRLHDVSLDDPPYFIAMDHIEGGDLHHWADAQGGIDQVPLATRIGIIAQAATTLQAAHDAGILHRDIKPSNLLIGTEDGSTKTYVADFGIGQLLSEDELGNTRLGFTRTVVGKATDSLAGSQRYMAPELLSGSPASVRSDIYSLGVVLYQMLTGDFNRALTVDWYDNIDDPLLEDDLKHCFSGDPEARFSSAGQLADRLNTLDGRRQDAAERADKARLLERRAYRRGVARTAGIAAVMMVALAWLTWFAFQKKSEAWNNESRFRLAEVRALRETSLPERRRTILARIEEARGNFPTEDIPAFRNEALAALAFPPPYGSEEHTIGELPGLAGFSTSQEWLIWHDGNTVHIDKITAGRIERQLEFKPGVPPSDVTIASGDAGWIAASLSTDGRLCVASPSEPVHQIADGCAPHGLAVHTSGMLAASNADGLIRIFEYEGDEWIPLDILGSKPPILDEQSVAEISPGPFTPSTELLSFSPGGHYLASGGNNSLYVQIWDVADWHLIGRCRQTSYPTAIAWDVTVEGKLWSAAADGALYGWNAFRSVAANLVFQASVSKSAAPTDLPTRHIDTSANGIYLVCTGEDRSLVFRSQASLEVEEYQSGRNVMACGYLPSGDLWTIHSDGIVKLRQIGQRIARLHIVGDQAVIRLTRSPDDRLIAGSSGNCLVVADATSLNWFERFISGSRIAGVSFSASEPKLFAAGVKGQYSWRWDQVDGLPKLTKLKVDKGIAGGGDIVSIKSRNGACWQAFSNGRSLILRGDVDADDWRSDGDQNITAIAAGRETSWIAVSRSGGAATELLYPDDHAVRTLPDPAGDVVGLSCPPDGAIIVQRTGTHVLVVMPPTGEVIASYQLPLPMDDVRTSPFRCAPIAVSDDASLIAATTSGSRIILFHRDRKSPVAELPLPPNSTPTSLLFTAEGALVIGTADGRLWMWQLLAMRQELARLGLDWKPAGRGSLDN